MSCGWFFSVVSGFGEQCVVCPIPLPSPFAPYQPYCPLLPILPHIPPYSPIAQNMRRIAS